MMTISKLIKELKEIRKIHGNLRCVVRGFDECGYDDINTIELTRIKPNAHAPNLHQGAHISLKYDDTTDGEIALEINF